MKITFISPTNDKKYELIDHQEVVSIGDATLNIEIGNDKSKFNFSIVFTSNTEKTNPYRTFELLEGGELKITLFNFYDGLGAFFPDIVDLNNGYSLHISSSYTKENQIRRTQIFYYKSKPRLFFKMKMKPKENK